MIELPAGVMCVGEIAVYCRRGGGCANVAATTRKDARRHRGKTT
ncbi:MAG: hypothetical protein ABSG76_04075 [Xanthobacteraceae bacterium]